MRMKKEKNVCTLYILLTSLRSSFILSKRSDDDLVGRYLPSVVCLSIINEIITIKNNVANTFCENIANLFYKNKNLMIGINKIKALKDFCCCRCYNYY